ACSARVARSRETRHLLPALRRAEAPAGAADGELAPILADDHRPARSALGRGAWPARLAPIADAPGFAERTRVPGPAERRRVVRCRRERQADDYGCGEYSPSKRVNRRHDVR